MLLALFMPAFANTLEVPFRVHWTEYTDWGADPVVVDDVRTAEVVLTNADTGEALVSDGELLLSDHSGAGTGELTFDGEPNGTVRTWALWLLDVNGTPLRAEPEVVDILFGDDGDGTIVARASADIVVRQVRMKKRGVSRTAEGSTHDIRVVVQNSGVNAAYVGIQELSGKTAPLQTHADMEAMTADVYASFQGLVLDGIVPLDTWKARLDGMVSIDGVDLDASGVPTSLKNVSVGVTFFGAKDGETIPELAKMYNKIEALVVKQKRAGAQAQRVIVDSDDQTFDAYDASVDVIVDGDHRNLEVAALLTPLAGAVAPVTDILQTLDPSDVAVAGTASGTGKFPSAPASEPVRTLFVRALSAEGKPLDDWRACSLTPTPRTAVAGSRTLRWSGECLRDGDLGADIRNVSMKMTSTGATTIGAELLGNEYQAAAKLEFDVSATELGLSTLTGAAAVSETRFELPFVFPSDAVGGAYELLLQFYGVTGALTTSLEGTGGYAWNETSETTTAAKEGVSDAVKQAYLDDQKEKTK